MTDKTIAKKILLVNIEIEENTTVEINDCDLVDIGGVEQSLSELKHILEIL